MAVNNRRMGIDIIGDAPWGTHLCQFYQTKEDLLDILVPYFKAGLENNEFCMWITSEPLGVKETKASLIKAVGNLDKYTKKGQIEILDYTEWYLKSGEFNANETLQGWVEKERMALEKGFDGLRLSGNTFWLEKVGWDDFTKYEEVINSIIGNHKMMAICTYSLDRCGISEILDVFKNHQFALIRRAGKWEIIESSERKMAEEALKKSEGRYGSLINDVVDNSAVGIFILDADFRVAWINRAIETYFGLAREEVVGRDKRQLIREGIKHVFEDPDGFSDRVLATYDNNTYIENFECHVLPSGKRKERWLEHWSQPIYSGFYVGGRTEYYTNITERKQAEEEIASLAKFPSENRNPVLCVSKDGTILYANEASMTLLKEWGCQVGKQLPKYWQEFTLGTLHSGSSNSADVKVGQRTLTLTFAPIVDAGYINIYGLDITERKQAEEKIRHLNLVLRTIRNVNQLIAEERDRKKLLKGICKSLTKTRGYYNAWIALLDESGKLVVHAESRLGKDFLPMVERLKQGWLPACGQTALKQPEAVVTEDPVSICTDCPLSVNYTGRRGMTVRLEHDGKVYGLLSVSVLLELANDAEELGLFHEVAGDIAFALYDIEREEQHKQAEAEKQELERKVQVTDRLASIGEMASGIAHEINNPLTGVVGFSELLMTKDLPEDLRKDVEIIHDGSQRVAGIVKRLLTFARQHKPERTYSDINEIIESTLVLRKYSLETGNIEVSTSLDAELPCTVADVGQLQQVFMNIIVNAETEMRKAHGRGKLTIKTEQIDNKIRISFKDDGPGIAGENLDKVFDPFFTTKEVGEGTGLGLSLSYGIIREHKGTIYAESEVGEGATFIIELPIVAEEEEKIETVEEAGQAIGGRILVVDDEPTILEFLKRVLDGEGYDVETADSGKEALGMIKNKRYSLILCDIKLPGLSGVEIYDEIRKVAPSLQKRVIFITGDVTSADTGEFLKRTKAPYVNKPFDIAKLKEEVKRVIAGAG